MGDEVKITKQGKGKIEIRLPPYLAISVSRGHKKWRDYTYRQIVQSDAVTGSISDGGTEGGLLGIKALRFRLKNLSDKKIAVMLELESCAKKNHDLVLGRKYPRTEFMKRGQSTEYLHEALNEEEDLNALKLSRIEVADEKKSVLQSFDQEIPVGALTRIPFYRSWTFYVLLTVLAITLYFNRASYQFDEDGKCVFSFRDFDSPLQFEEHASEVLWPTYKLWCYKGVSIDWRP